MNQYETLIAEAEKTVSHLREAKHSQAAFLIRTLLCSLKKEVELRVSYEQDLTQQRDYLEKLNVRYIQLTGRLPEIE